MHNLAVKKLLIVTGLVAAVVSFPSLAGIGILLMCLFAAGLR